MKKTILKIAAATLLGAALIAIPTVSRADDSTNTAPAAAGPAKFYGKISAVDTNAMTFTVDDQTYVVTSESTLTKGGKPATIADATVGEPARGSYTTGSDGKLDITKVRFGKGGGGGKKGGSKKKKDSDASGSSDGSAAAPATPPSN
jgi:hypothetical protein